MLLQNISVAILSKIGYDSYNSVKISTVQVAVSQSYLKLDMTPTFQMHRRQVMCLSQSYLKLDMTPTWTNSRNERFKWSQSYLKLDMTPTRHRI